MSYKAIITPVVNVREHPNADRLQLGTAAGYQVVLDLTTQEGEIGVFFPTDGKLDEGFLKENNLYRHKHLNRNPLIGGFFDDNGRVRTQKFRKERSEGFWIPLSSLEWTGIDTSTLKKGHLFDEINGHKICEKYFTPATIKEMRVGKQKRGWKHRLKEEFPFFKEHYDTEQLRFYAEYIPKGSVCWITEKCHGTSGRTSYSFRKRSSGWWSKLMRWLKGRPGDGWEYVSGTRKVVLNPDAEDNGYYSGKKFRTMIHEMFKNAGLRKGETVFYEIVGYMDTGEPIMKHKGVQDKALKKRYGERMVYSYGCNPDMPGKQFKVLIYRITTTNEDGFVTEIPFNILQYRCKELGVESVPLLHGPFIHDGDAQNLQMICHTFAEEGHLGESTLDHRHIREGVVLRVEHELLQKAYKMKSFAFSELEGIAKQFDDYIDIEEVS